MKTIGTSIRYIGWFALGLIAATSPALAQKAAPADIAAIKACLKAAGEKASFGGECIGIVADPCIKAAAPSDDGGSTKVKACAARELAAWSPLLDDALKRIAKGGFPDITKAVTAAQKTWAASRDQLCPVFDKIEPGMYLGGTAYCRLQETARRVLSLDKLGDAVNEH
jgi:uncharacterized protein YecT (DUF1311 family)